LREIVVTRKRGPRNGSSQQRRCQNGVQPFHSRFAFMNSHAVRLTSIATFAYG
jgi:hypothetical protein